MSEFDPHVSIASPGHITVSSPLTFATAQRVCEAGVACIMSDASPMIIVDCSGVPNGDSAGLAVLIEWRRWAHHQGHHLKFTKVPAQIIAIAHLSEIEELLADAVA